MSVNSKMTALADEIRELSGTTEAMGLDAMTSTLKQVKPEVSVNSSNGLITATAGTKASTHQLAFQPAKTITPSTASQIAVPSGYYTGGNVMVAGDANLVASNIKNGVSIFGISGTLVEGGGESGDGYDEVDSLITRTISSYTNKRVSSIGFCAFAYAGKLESVNFPAAITINNSAFQNCNSLTTVSFPAAITIGSYAFQNCYNLTTVSFPVATTISTSAFAGCDNLTTVSFPAAITIGSYAFQNCDSLTTVSFPAAIIIGDGAFHNCDNLTTVSFPAAITIGDGAFRECHNLKSLYLTNSVVCALSNSGAFYATPYAGYSVYFSGTPYIYVPQSLLTSYQTATNWTYFSSYFSVAASDDGDDGNIDNNLIRFILCGNAYQAEDGMTFKEWVNSEYNVDGWKIFRNMLESPDNDPLMINIDDVIEAGQEYW